VFLRRPELRDVALTICSAYNEFLGALSDDSVRQHLEQLLPERHNFRDGLLKLFFDCDSDLTELTQIYGLFL
jgi:hypothetical protein